MKSTYIFHYSHQSGHLYNIIMELDSSLSWEQIYHNFRYTVLVKNIFYKGKLTYSVDNMVEIYDLFCDALFSFETIIKIEGTNYTVMQKK